MTILRTERKDYDVADELAETAKIAAERLKNTAKTVADELRENGTRRSSA